MYYLKKKIHAYVYNPNSKMGSFSILTQGSSLLTTLFQMFQYSNCFSREMTKREGEIPKLIVAVVFDELTDIYVSHR